MTEDAEITDVTRRTRLANERTYLAWWRSGLTALAVALAVGKVAPELSGGAAWGYEVVGVGYAALGLAFLVYGERRRRVVEAHLARGDFPPLDGRASVALVGVGALLGLGTLILIAV